MERLTPEEFTSLQEAAGGFEEINTRYEHHCAAARDIAETYFDAPRVLETAVNAALRPSLERVS